jgi:hypothetical protein
MIAMTLTKVEIDVPGKAAEMLGLHIISLMKA